ncbi:MAG: tetratricopeptide repeat protein [Rhodovibrionaceae bacterium]
MAERPHHSETAPAVPEEGEAESAAAEAEAERDFTRGVELHRGGRLDEAVEAYARAVTHRPDHSLALNNLAVALRGKGRFGAAEVAYRRALAAAPDNPGLHSNLGNLLREVGRAEEAKSLLERAVSGGEETPEILHNYALALRDTGDFEAALEVFDRALARAPGIVPLAADRATTLLAAGDYKSGFSDLFDWHAERARHSHLKHIPLWRGEALNGRKLLIHAESRDADSIMLARYLPFAARLAKQTAADPQNPGELVLETPASLTRLFTALPGVDRLVVRGEGGPEVDLRLPLYCLPGLFLTTRETILGRVPFLRAPEHAGPELRRPRGTRLLVGLVWNSEAPPPLDLLGSCGLETLLPLAAERRASFFSLQKGTRAADVIRYGTSGLVHDLSGRLEDLADIAGVIAQLDLLIAVDSAQAHLAGALGRPVWLLAPTAPDWRWRGEGETTPWYPSMRIFRQPKPGDWEGLRATLARELGRLAADSGEPEHG